MALSRTSMLGLLIVLSIIFAILLTFVSFKLWKYLKRNKENEDRLSLLDEEEGLDHFPPPDLYGASKKKVPITCTTVLGQEPFPKLPDSGLSNEMPSIKEEATKKKTNKVPSMLKRGSICDEEYLHFFAPENCDCETPAYKRQSPKNSERPGYKRPSSKFSKYSPPSLKETKRKLSRRMTRSSRREINLRGASITEEMFHQTMGRLSPGRSTRIRHDIKMMAQNTEGAEPPDGATESGNSKARILLGLQPKGIYGVNNEENANALHNRPLFKKGGKIVFKMKYTEETKELEVDILKAFDLANNRDMMEINPYVRVCLLPGKKQKQDTKHKKQPTKEPFFNEKIIFEGIASEDLASLKLNLKVCNHSRSITKKKETLGSAEIALSSLETDREKSACVTLFQKRYKITTGTICLSVCHEATQAKLIANIHDAHLPKSTMKSNSSVAATLYKGDLAMMTKQTSTKRMTSNPCYEESLEFEVRATTAENLGIYSLDVILQTTSQFGKVNSLGHVVLSVSSQQQTAQQQWKSVVELPHQYHKATHGLIDPEDR